jgi:hypothetical protein
LDKISPSKLARTDLDGSADDSTDRLGENPGVVIYPFDVFGIDVLRGRANVSGRRSEKETRVEDVALSGGIEE